MLCAPLTLPSPLLPLASDLLPLPLPFDEELLLALLADFSFWVPFLAPGMMIVVVGMGGGQGGWG